MAAKKNVQRTIRLPEDLHRALVACAEMETRNFNQQVAHFIKLGLLEYARTHPEFDKFKKLLDEKHP